MKAVSEAEKNIDSKSNTSKNVRYILSDGGSVISMLLVIEYSNACQPSRIAGTHVWRPAFICYFALAVVVLFGGAILICSIVDLICSVPGFPGSDAMAFSSHAITFALSTVSDMAYI